MIEHYNDDGYSYSNRSNIVSSLWAFAVIVGMVVLLLVIGLCATVYFGGDDWAQIYLIAVGVLLVLSLLYAGFYGIAKLLVGHALGLQRSNADLLHAHSQSGAQQARAITEVVRGVNQINAADAKTQQAILSNYASLGATYEKRLAELSYRAQLAEQKMNLLQAPVDDDDSPYLMPTDGEVVNYKLPKVS